MRRITLAVFATTFLVANTAFSQMAPGDQKVKKNTLSIVFSENNFFDGHKMFAFRPDSVGGYTPFVKGLEYMRRLSPRLEIQASVRLCNHYYWDANQYGDVSTRYAFFWELNIQRQFWKKEGLSFNMLAGIFFRHGGENVLANRYFGERLHDNYTLRDPGLNIGGRIQYELSEKIKLPLLKNLVFATEAKFTQILLRFNSSLPNRTFYPNRSTTQMLTLQLGLGYRF